MALRILTTTVTLLCLKVAFSLVDISNIGNSSLVIKGITRPCTGFAEFQCEDIDNSCIFIYFLCDTIIDCPNGADEDPAICDWTELCEVKTPFENVKPFRMATCNNTMCITECDLCDGHYLDCVDGSDEDPALCNGDNRPQIVGDCKSYRESYPIPADKPGETTTTP